MLSKSDVLSLTSAGIRLHSHARTAVDSFYLLAANEVFCTLQVRLRQSARQLNVERKAIKLPRGTSDMRACHCMVVENPQLVAYVAMPKSST